MPIWTEEKKERITNAAKPQKRERVMNLKQFLESVGGKESDIKVFKTHKESLVACEQDGYALRYVKDQTEAICKVACEQDGYALQYVDVRVFAKLRPDDAKLKDALETTSAYLRKND